VRIREEIALVRARAAGEEFTIAGSRQYGIHSGYTEGGGRLTYLCVRITF